MSVHGNKTQALAEMTIYRMPRNSRLILSPRRYEKLGNNQQRREPAAAWRQQEYTHVTAMKCDQTANF